MGPEEWTPISSKTRHSAFDKSWSFFSTTDQDTDHCELSLCSQFEGASVHLNRVRGGGGGGGGGGGEGGLNRSYALHTRLRNSCRQRNQSGKLVSLFLGHEDTNFASNSFKIPQSSPVRFSLHSFAIIFCFRVQNDAPM